MRRFEHETRMGRIPARGGFFLRLCAPEHERHRLRKLRQRGDRRVGEALPAETAVAVGPALLHGQDGVQKKHALLRPAGQAARGERRAHVRGKLLSDVHERRRHPHAVAHRKRKPVRLPRLVIRVLPQNDGAHALRRRQPEGGKDVLLRRKDRSGGIRRRDLLHEHGKIRRGKLGAQKRRPARGKLQILHGSSSKMLSVYYICIYHVYI